MVVEEKPAQEDLAKKKGMHSHISAVSMKWRCKNS